MTTRWLFGETLISIKLNMKTCLLTPPNLIQRAECFTSFHFSIDKHDLDILHLVGTVFCTWHQILSLFSSDFRIKCNFVLCRLLGNEWIWQIVRCGVEARRIREKTMAPGQDVYKAGGLIALMARFDRSPCWGWMSIQLWPTNRLKWSNSNFQTDQRINVLLTNKPQFCTLLPLHKITYLNLF